MNLSQKEKNAILKQFQSVLETPAGFDFFLAIHDLVENIEQHPPLTKHIARGSKGKSTVDIVTKYGHLKRVYQGFEDKKDTSRTDLGHDRYMVIQAIVRIQNKETSENNFLWKKRDLFRKLAEEIRIELGKILAIPLEEAPKTKASKSRIKEASADTSL